MGTLRSLRRGVAHKKAKDRGMVKINKESRNSETSLLGRQNVSITPSLFAQNWREWSKA